MLALAFTLNRAEAKSRHLAPGTALAGATCLSVIVACLQNPAACIAALGVGILLLIISKAFDRALFARFAAVNFFVLFLWLFTPWATPGTIIWRWHWIAVSKEGLHLCLIVTLKANAIVAIFSALVAPLSISALARGLASLRCPARLAWLLLLMEPNIHILKREWRNLTAAAKLRAFRPRSSMAAYRTMASMLALWLARAQIRAGKLREAMLLAAFTGELQFQVRWRPQTREIPFYLFIFIAGAVLIYINYEQF